MLGFDRRIVLEDHLGDRHGVYLLEAIGGHFFVLLEPDPADVLAALQAAGAELEAALEVLEDELQVMDVRSHRFLPPHEVPEVLARSNHHVLTMLGLRLGGTDLPRTAPPEVELSAHAFAEELRRRATW